MLIVVVQVVFVSVHELHAMKICKEVEVSLQTFSISALSGCDVKFKL